MAKLPRFCRIVPMALNTGPSAAPRPWKIFMSESANVFNGASFSATAPISTPNDSLRICDITPPKPLNTPERTLGSAKAVALITSTMTGRTFSMTVPAASISCCVMERRSASGLASAVSQFFQAAFIMFTLPSMVVAASFAVVPVMPIFSCMMWMASVTSANESMLRSAISPLAFLTAFASLIILAISAFVPPYPSLRLSSMA